MPILQVEFICGPKELDLIGSDRTQSLALLIDGVELVHDGVMVGESLQHGCLLLM